MAYRRRIYRKRKIFRKKRNFSRRKVYRRKSVNNPKSYNGQMNVKCEYTQAMIQSNAQDGVKMCVLWGANTGLMTGAPNSWPATHVIGPFNTTEWNLYHASFQEYAIVGCKIRYIPATFIGDQTDGRTTRQLHVGSSNEAMTQTALTVQRLQVASDYKGYSMNYNTPVVKRYYKPMAHNSRRGNTMWFSTSNVQYSEALTYAFWQISGVDQNALVVGDF